MAYYAYCGAENGASHFADRDRCLWESRFKYHKKENADIAASRHHCGIRWEGWGYHSIRKPDVRKLHGNCSFLKKKKWGD